jgi:allantoicase
MRGTVSSIEVDTNYFKGNYPDRCSLEAIDAPGARLTDLAAGARWSTLLPEAKLEPDGRQFFTLAKMQASLAVTHARFNIFPDGGVSRLRLWGSPR